MTIFRRRRDADFSAELDAHLQLEADRLVAEGMDPVEAAYAAKRAFGSVTAARERFHEAGRWRIVEQFAQDLRYAWRSMRQSPAFVATAVWTLAIGIGLVTVAFAILNAYFLRPYAVRNPYELHQIGWQSKDGGGQRFRWRDYEALRNRADLFTAAVGESTRLVSSDGRTLAVALVSPNYFEALGPALVLGRGLGLADAADAVAVISEEAWSRLFARDPGAVGRQIDLSGRRFVIVGVVAARFTGLSDMPRDVWVPLEPYATFAAPDLAGAGQQRAIEVLVRLQPGITAAAAAESLTSMMADVVDRREQEVRAQVRPQPSAHPLSVEMVAALAPVFAAFVLVLVTACANVSNVMLARGLARHREIALRLSLGASRSRIVRQLLTEGLVVAVLAGLAALVFASWMLRAGTAALFGTLPPSVAAMVRVEPLELDGRVFLFALATAAAATLLFALLPALQASRLTLTHALRGLGTGTRTGSRLRSALVVSQVAVSLVLVIAAVTLARNGSAVGATDLGYETRGVISINVRGDNDGLIRPLAEALALEPRVGQVAVTGGNPLFIRKRSVAAAPADASDAVATRYTFVSPEYFSLLRIPIERGRSFRPDEARQRAPTAVVSQATARRFWPGADPIGRTLRIERAEGRPVEELPGYSLVTVVGTVPDVVSGLLVDGRDAGHIYLPVDATSPDASALLLRPPSQHVGPATLQEIFRRVARDPEIFEALPLDEMRALQAYPFRAASWVGSLLGLVALALSVTGLYGVLSYTMGQRTKEIGIRMALGATAGAVVRLVLRQSTRLAGVGMAIGLATSFAVMKTLNAAIQLRNVSLLDAAAFGGGIALVLAAACAAAYQPARRATRVDPSQTLRADA